MTKTNKYVHGYDVYENERLLDQSGALADCCTPIRRTLQEAPSLKRDAESALKR